MDEQEAKNALPTPNNTQYLIAIMVMAVVTVLAIVVVAFIQSEQDKTMLYAVIVGFATTTTGTVLAFMKSQETHLSVNSRLEQVIRIVDRAARSEGELAGRAAGREIADSRTDMLKDKETTAPKNPS